MIATNKQGKTRELDGRILVDFDDECWLVYKWYINKRGYAAFDQNNDGLRVRVLLHRVIMDAKPGEVVDHINGNTLDNRRSNLRIVTKAENNHNQIGLNQRNTSGYRGVTFDKRRGKWRAQGCVFGKRHFLGDFADREQAARVARDWRKNNMPGAMES